MHQIMLAFAVVTAGSHPVPAPSPPTPPTPIDTVGCRTAAIAAVKTWLGAIGTGDTAAVRKAISPAFVGISAGRNGWPEPFFRAKRMNELFAYVRRRAAQHERIDDVAIPLGSWHDSRVMLGAVSYARTADDITGKEHWLGKGEYTCGQGISVLNTSPQGSPRQRK